MSLWSRKLKVEICIELLFKKLYSLKTLYYIGKQQTEYYSNSHENISVNEVLLTGDFWENYSFIQQNEAQSHYFNMRQTACH